MSLSSVFSFYGAVVVWVLFLWYVRGRRYRRGEVSGGGWWFIAFFPFLLGLPLVMGWAPLPQEIEIHWAGCLASWIMLLPLSPIALWAGGLKTDPSLVVLVIALLLGGWAQWGLLRPLADLVEDHVVSQNVVLQQHPASSGSAALASILLQADCPMTESVVAETIAATPLGIRAGEIAVAAEVFGCTKVLSTTGDMSDLEAWKGNAILAFHGESWYLTQWVAFVGRRKKMWVILDPSEGRRLIGDAELQSLWDGRLIFLYPPVK